MWSGLSSSKRKSLNLPVSLEPRAVTAAQGAGEDYLAVDAAHMLGIVEASIARWSKGKTLRFLGRVDEALALQLSHR